MSNPGGDRTYLRVRRKRSGAAAEAIYLQGLDKAASDERNTNYSNQRIAVWRRVGEPEDHSNVRKRAYRVLDAVLEDDDDAVSSPHDNRSELQNELYHPATKRRRLTLLPPSFLNQNNETILLHKQHPQSPRHRGARRAGAIRILHPVERLVDDSLQQVFQGSVSVADHYRLITTDARLADQAVKWCAWNTADGGSLLHTCALWNEYEILQQVLELFLQQQQQNAATSSIHNSASSFILDGVDGDGRTPYQLAELSGHEQVCQVLEAYGAGDYLVDLYALDDDPHEMMMLNEEEEQEVLGNGTGFRSVYPDDNAINDDTGNYLACELQGGVGYWNEDGQLVLQHTLSRTMSTVSLRDDDESVDSNDEEWEGNDYPDFEDAGDIDDDEYHGMEGANNGGYAVAGRPGRRHSPSAVVDPHGDFDGAYGVYGQRDEEEYDDEI